MKHSIFSLFYRSCLGSESWMFSNKSNSWTQLRTSNFAGYVSFSRDLFLWRPNEFVLLIHKFSGWSGQIAINQNIIFQQPKFPSNKKHAFLSYLLRVFGCVFGPYNFTWYIQCNFFRGLGYQPFGKSVNFVSKKTPRFLGVLKPNKNNLWISKT